VSLDKPPVAFWIQTASAKLLGYSGCAVILPQILEGTAAIAVVYQLVCRRFGSRGGLFAALFPAITPVSVTMDRGNNTDTCLVLVLLLAARLSLVSGARFPPRSIWRSPEGSPAEGVQEPRVETPVKSSTYAAETPKRIGTGRRTVPAPEWLRPLLRHRMHRPLPR